MHKTERPDAAGAAQSKRIGPDAAGPAECNCGSLTRDSGGAGRRPRLKLPKRAQSTGPSAECCMPTFTAALSPRKSGARDSLYRALCQSLVRPFQPRFCFEALEDLARFRAQRLGFFGAVLREQPLGVLELHDGEPERHAVLAKDLLGGLEALLDGVVLASRGRDEGAEADRLGAEERRPLTRTQP